MLKITFLKDCKAALKDELLHDFANMNIYFVIDSIFEFEKHTSIQFHRNHA